jgi:hypothetical protein
MSFWRRLLRIASGESSDFAAAAKSLEVGGGWAAEFSGGVSARPLVVAPASLPAGLPVGFSGVSAASAPESAPPTMARKPMAATAWTSAFRFKIPISLIFIGRFLYRRPSEPDSIRSSSGESLSRANDDGAMRRGPATAGLPQPG